MDIIQNSVVISLAGHDKGRVMMAARVEEKFVYVCDGKERKLQDPKKKNKKHVRATHFMIENEALTDKRLRQCLREISAKSETGE